MANPTPQTILGVPEGTVSAILTNLNLAPTTDARLATREILNVLHQNYQTNFALTAPLQTYTVAKSATNIDLNTQRETYTFTVDLALVATSVIDEPV
jgi:hypothetical protein